MLDYKLDIADNSKWVICTKPEAAKALPFYITEAGEFYAKSGYYTERDGRDGLQLIYTVSGEGRLIADNTETRLLPGSAVIIRCGEHHRYETVGNGWHGKGRLPKESGYSERRVPGLPQNMRQTVTGLWSAIIGRT